MSKAPYPLDAVERLRTHARDEAALDCREVEARLREAEEALVTAEAAHERARAARAAFASRERGDACSDGSALQREASYAARLHAELATAAEAARSAQARRDAVRRELAAAQARLAQAEGERAVLARDHARHENDERRRKERADELEQEEGLLARHPRQPR